MIRVSDRANRIKKNCSQNKGFTLVELIIVIAILAILCGLSAVGILSWQDWATFKKENEYAKTLFVAAQNQLTEYVANERIIELQEDLLEENGVDADGYVIYKTKDGINSVNIETLTADENLANLWASTDGRSDIIVSLTAKAGDYQTYLSSPESVGRDTYWLFELLGSYVYDTSILNEGAITVEFTPEDGQVFAVLYTDKHSSFTDGGYNTNDRTEANRRPNMIGYYGVDSLSKATKNTLVKDKINVHKVRLYNKETLYLTFIVDELNSSLNSNETSYTINLLSKDKEEGKTEREKLITISFSGPLKKEQNPVNANEIDAKVTCYSLSSNNTKDMKILAWQEETGDTVHVVLDAADIAADAYTYNTGYDNIVYGTEDSTVPARTFCADDFRTTYSFFRFGLEVQDIYAQVAVTNDNYKPSNYVDNTIAQGAKNTVFAGVDGNEYSIRNARHLYNIRYMEVANAYADRNNPATGVVGAGITFKINDDINWEDFQRKSVDGKLSGYLYDSSCDIENSTKTNVSNSLVGKKTEITTKEKAVYYCDFPSIPAIRSKDTVDGNGKTITGINVSKEENQIFKAYTILDGSSAKDGTIKPTGFIDINYGTIKNLKMDKLTVSGEDYVGGFVGVNAGKLEKLTLDNTLDDKKKDTSIIKGKKNVGGIVGLVLATNDNDKLVANYKAYDNEYNEIKNQKFVVLTGLTNSARVEGKDGVGGIVGSLTNDFSAIKSSVGEFDGLSTEDKNLLSATNSKCNMAVYDCTNKGLVADNADDDSSEGKNFGGIAGYIYNKDKINSYRVNITKCVSTPQINDEDNMFDGNDVEVELSGEYVGGIVGSNNCGQINACRTQTKDDEIGYIYGNKYVGGIAGYNNGIIRNSENSDISNSAYVRGTDYVGGIAGYNDTDAIINNYQVEKGKVIGETDGRFTGGYVGFNSSVDLIMNNNTKVARDIICNPDAVDGGYFTGGIIGGNIINTNSYTGVSVSETNVIESVVEEEKTEITTPLEAVQIEDISKGYAQYGGFTMDSWISENTDSNTKDTYGYLIHANLTIYNNTGENIVSWIVPLEYNNGKEFPVYIKTSDYIYDELTHQITWGRDWNSNISVSQNRYISVEILGKSKQDIQDYMNYVYNTKLPVIFFYESDNRLGEYWGNAKNPGEVNCNFSTEIKGENELKVYFNVYNNTTKPIPNWRIEMDVPEGTTCSSDSNFGKNVEYSSDGTVLSIKSSNDYHKSLGANNYLCGANNIYVVLSFKDKASREAFNTDNIRLSFNNVLYRGTATINRPGSSSSNGSTNEVIVQEDPIIENLTTILASYKMDDSPESVEGNAFVGGYIGYNMFIDSENISAVDEIQKYIVEAFNDSDDDKFYLSTLNHKDSDGKAITYLSNVSDNSVHNKLREKLLIVENIRNKSIDGVAYITSGITMFMDGTNYPKADNVDGDELNSIKGSLLVGGVFGYNDADTKLYIKNVTNNANVMADDAIIHPEEQLVTSGSNKISRSTNYSGEVFTYKYSYAGGIVSKVTTNTVIKNCSNDSVVKVISYGTYTGGLCEINEGLIKYCDVTYLGEEGKEYIGGLCGLNKSTGTIWMCSFGNATMLGKNMVGAIASENFGSISRIKLTNPKMNINSNDSVDGVVGLYAAYNEGTIELETNIKGVDILSTGKYVGTITGYNNGKIDVVKKDATEAVTSDTRAKALAVSGTVVGKQTVGAFIGKNISEESISYLINKAAVTAQSGEAGGIVGSNESINTVEYCYNDGTVKTTDNGCVGGLVGLVSNKASNIRHCYNYSIIESKGVVGGLIGQITGTDLVITMCDNYGDITGQDDSIGGLVGWHFATSGNLRLVECRNHGNITRDLSNSTTSVIVGGLLGGTQNVSVDMDNCVNTGVVKAIGVANLSGNTINKIGSYIGTTDAEVLLNVCRNYNTLIPDESDASTGLYSAKKYCGSDDDNKLVHAINCLDDTGNNTQGYPVIGVDDSSKVYFVDEESRFDRTDYGVYFNVQNVNGNFRYNNDNYGTKKNNSLYLLEPSVINSIDSVNTIAITMDYTMDSEGIDAIEAFFWSGQNNIVDTKCVISNATFYDQEGKSHVVNNNSIIYYNNKKSATSSFGITDEARVIIKSPISKPARLVIKISVSNSTRNMFRGFAYIPKMDTSKEAVCTYAGEGWGVSFDLVNVKWDGKEVNSYTDIDKNISSNLATIKSWNDYLIYDYSNSSDYMGKKELDLLNQASNKYLELEFNIDNKSNSEIEKFVFYLGNNDSWDTKTYSYEYEVILEYGDEEPKVSISGVKDGVKKNKEETGKVEISIPKKDGNYVKKIVLRVKEKHYNNGVYNVNDYDVFIRGFGFVPNSEEGIHQLPTASSDSDEILENIINSQQYIPLYVSTNNGSPYVYSMFDKAGQGFTLTNSSNNPIGNNFTGDESSQGSYLTSTTTPANSGNRADIYLDMDSKFVDYINRKSSTTSISSTHAREMSLMAMSFDDFAFEEEDDDTLDSPDVFSLGIDDEAGMALYDDADLNSTDEIIDHKVSEEDFAKGINFVFDGDTYHQFADAYGNLVDLEMAIAVYDFESEDEANGPTDDQKYDMRSSDNANVSWNEGAIETIYSKEAGDTLVLGYDGNAYRGHLDIGKSYAGKWLKIALKARSTDGSMIDSEWSDEDANYYSVNYAWIHIPLVEVSEVETNAITPTPSPEDAPAITPNSEAGEGTSEVTPQPTPDPILEVTPEPTSTPEGEGADPTPEETPDAA